MAEQPRIVVIGASAGGVDALMHLVRELPADFPAPICVVLHIPADSPSLLAQILSRCGPLPAKHAENGDRYQPGHIYIAPPDRHLVIGEDATLLVARGPRENRHRPAVDPLFRSAALQYGRRAIGVVLSGTLDDGTAGMITLQRAGAIAVVQEPSSALFAGMPQSVIDHVDVDYAVPIGAMAALLTRLVREPAPSRPAAPPHKHLAMEVHVAELDAEALHDDDRPGQPSPYSCPDCGGVLWEIEEGEYARYRCRVGHAYSPESMLGAQDDILEEALWTAMKTLEESARLSQRLALTERTRGHDWLATRFEEKERDARSRVEVIRRFLLRAVDAPVPVNDRQGLARDRPAKS